MFFIEKMMTASGGQALCQLPETAEKPIRNKALPLP
jgi:hypothetical protein